MIAGYGSKPVFQYKFRPLLQDHRVMQKILRKDPEFCKKKLPKCEKMFYSKAVNGLTV